MNKDLLKGKLREKALTQSAAAERLGISLSTFNAKLNGRGGAEFSLGELRALKGLLSLDGRLLERIFFN